jgi:hypothetical protein
MVILSVGSAALGGILVSGGMFHNWLEPVTGGGEEGEPVIAKYPLMVITLLLVAAGVATQLVYPWLYSALLDGNPVAVAVQTVRVGLTLGDPDSRMRRTTALLVAAGLATQLVYPWLYSALLDGNPVAVAVQTVRVGLTIAATWCALGVLLRPGRPAAQVMGSGPSSASGSPPSSITRNRSAEWSQPHDDSTH